MEYKDEFKGGHIRVSQLGTSLTANEANKDVFLQYGLTYLFKRNDELHTARVIKSVGPNATGAKRPKRTR